MRAANRPASLERSRLALRIAAADLCDHSDRLRLKSTELLDRLGRQLDAGPRGRAERPAPRVI